MCGENLPHIRNDGGSMSWKEIENYLEFNPLDTDPSQKDVYKDSR